MLNSNAKTDATSEKTDLVPLSIVAYQVLPMYAFLGSPYACLVGRHVPG